METIKTQIKVKHNQGDDVGYIQFHDDLKKLQIKPSSSNDNTTLIEIGTIIHFQAKKYKVTRMTSKFFKTRNDSGLIENVESEEFPSYNFEIVYGVDDIE
jgi:hypothetical protein